MDTVKEVNKYILECIKKGKLEKDMAFKILKQINSRAEEHMDIAVVGMAGRFPGAENKEEFWKNLTTGVCSIGTIPQARRQDMLDLSDDITSEMEYMKSGYLTDIDKFDAGFFGISPKEALLMDPAQRLLLEVSHQAMEDGNYGDKALWGTTTGVFIGIDNTHKSEYAQKFKEKEFLALTGSFSGVLASRISYTLNFKGPCMVIDTACSSSLAALHAACGSIRNGECKSALVGGLNLMLSNNNMAVSDLEAADGKIKVFDDGANGMVWAEGLGAVYIKPLNAAIKDKDQIYGLIKGSAINNNGQANGITALNPQAQEQVILKAWKNAKIDPSSISYIEAHSSGTVFGDSIEVKAISNAFRKHTKNTQFCALGTSKTHVGHMVGASGIGGIIKILLGFKYKQLPGFLNFEKLNQHINLSNSPVFIHNELSDWKPINGKRTAGINSFGFNGTNCHVVLEEFAEAAEKTETGKTQELFVLSARSRDVLENYINRYIDFINTDNQFNRNSLKNICCTAALGRGHYECRLAFIVNSHEELLEDLKLIKAGGFLTDESRGIYFGEHYIVPASKKEKEENEITESQRVELTKKAGTLTDESGPEFIEDKEKAAALCMLYSGGAFVSWEKLYDPEAVRKVRLPLYPLRRTRYWIESKHNTVMDALQEMALDGSASGIVLADYVPPESEEEVKMAAIWQGVLGLEKVGVNDNFFDIGGDSMQALQIVEEAVKEGIHITITTVLDHRTIKQILEHAGEMETDLGRILVPEENMGDWTMLPYANQNKLTAYLHRALPAGVILGHEQLRPWYYEHYIDLCTQIGDDGQLMLDYAEINTAHSPVVDHIKIPYTEMMKVEDLTGYIEDKIDNKQYVIISLDEFYLPGKIHYEKDHFVHESTIYGYNKTERVFLGYGFNKQNMLAGLTFNYDDIVQAFEMSKIHYKETSPYSELQAVRLLSVKEQEGPIVFHPEVFIRELSHYLDSSRVQVEVEGKGVIERITIIVPVYGNEEGRDYDYDNYLPLDRIAYGLDVYNGIYHGLEKMQKGERIYDYRLFHALAEHKRGLYERLLFIAETYHLDENFTGMIEQYKNVVDLAEKARRLALELMYLGDNAPTEELVNIVTQIIEYMMPLREMETQILSGVLQYLKAVDFK